jgi:hypothetical protein
VACVRQCGDDANAATPATASDQYRSVRAPRGVRMVGITGWRGSGGSAMPISASTAVRVSADAVGNGAPDIRSGVAGLRSKVTTRSCRPLT